MVLTQCNCSMVLKHFIEINEKKPRFQLFFLKDKEDLSVEVDEVNKIDFEIVVQRLKQGESVFIAQKRPRERELNQSLFGAKKPCISPIHRDQSQQHQGGA